jgi:hypothetical protein
MPAHKKHESPAQLAARLEKQAARQHKQADRLQAQADKALMSIEKAEARLEVRERAAIKKTEIASVARGFAKGAAATAAKIRRKHKL